MRFAVFALALALPSALQAQDFMDVVEFEAFVTGKTLDFIEDGQPYGSEEFLPGRRVNWRYVGEIDCHAGTYEQNAEYICFNYDGEDELSCSTFWLEGDKLMSRFSDALPDEPLSIATAAQQPLSCGITTTGS